MTSNRKSKMSSHKLSNDDEDKNDDDSDEMDINGHIEYKTFFFFDIDDRLQEGLDNFVRTEDLNELQKAWPTKRKQIGEALRAKHRKALQHNDKRRIFNYRRGQNQRTISKV